MLRVSPATLSTATGLLLVVVGLVVFATGPAASFGWFSYGVVGIDADDVSRLVVLTPRRLVGLGITAIGALLSAAALGFRLGSRTPGPP